jgi:hypothetical protein
MIETVMAFVGVWFVGSIPVGLIVARLLAHRSDEAGTIISGTAYRKVEPAMQTREIPAST